MNIFLSYGHDANEPLIKQIKTDLEARGHEVWFDKAMIKAGDDWRRAITDGVLGSDWMLSFLSQHSTRNPGVCLDELGIALGVKGGIVQTILVESEKDISPPVSVGHIQWLDMHDWKSREESDLQAYEAWYQEKLAEIIRVVESDTNQRFAGEIQSLQDKLKPIACDARIGGLLKQGFFGRAWLVNEIEAWRTGNRDSRVFWIAGEPGIGKSALSAWLAHHSKANLIAAQFVEYNQPDKKDPRRVIRSIAFQIATRLPDYRKFLIGLAELDNLDSKNAPELFDYLLANPLNYGIKGGRDRYLILIDALDEAADGSDNALVAMLAEQAQKLPDWIGLVVTSRPEPKILRVLSHLAPNELKADDPRNDEDLRSFLSAWFDKRGHSNEAETCLPQILDAAEGNFLYLRQFCEGVEQGWIDLAKPQAYPKGMTGLYGSFFKRQFSDTDAYEKYQAPLLELVIASSQPLPEELAAKILGWQGRDKVKVLEPLGSLFPKANGTIVPFHKSLKDWLQDYDRSGDYFVPVEEGQRKLGEALWQDFLEKRKQPDTLPDYSMTELPMQLLAWRAEVLESLITKATWEETHAEANEVAEQLYSAIRWQEAEHWKQLIVRLDEQIFGTEHLKTASSLNNLAVVLSDLGKFEEAEQLYRKSFSIRKRNLGLEASDTLTVFINLTELLITVGKFDQAAIDTQQVLGVLRECGNKSGVDYGRLLISSGRVLSQQRKYEEAENHFEEAIEVLQKVDKKWGSFLSSAIFGLFMSIRAQDPSSKSSQDDYSLEYLEKLERSVAHLRSIFEARYLASRIPNPGEPPFQDSIKASTTHDLAMTSLILGHIASREEESGSFDEAKRYLNEAIGLWENSKNPAMTARSMWLLGYLLGLSGQKELALSTLNSAHRKITEIRGALHPESELVKSILHALRSPGKSGLLEKHIQDKVMLYGWETDDVSLTEYKQHKQPRRLVD